MSAPHHSPTTMSKSSAPPPRKATPLLTIAAILTFAVVQRLLLMPGLGGTDDVLYSLRGLEISHGDWRYSTDPGDLRFGIVLPIALLSHLLGNSDIALTAWSLICSLLEITAVTILAGRYWGHRGAILAGLLVSLTPMHVALAGRPLADAPFAAFITLAFTGLFLAEKDHSRPMAVLSGVALGMCWCIKPTATIPLIAIFLVSIAWFRRLFYGWWLIALAFICIVSLEWLLLWNIYGDPLHTLRVLLPFLRTHQEYTGDPFWGYGTPAFYFQMMFRDMRDLWLLPHIAMAGLAFLVIRRQAENTRGDFGRYVVYWLVLMILAYSFFPISINPIKFIPKQENYAIIFVAPLALAGSWALLKAGGGLQALVVLIIGFGSFGLTSLEQQTVHNKQSRLDQSIAQARANNDSTYLVFDQAIRVAKLRELQGYPKPTNLQPITAYYPEILPPGLAPSTIASESIEHRPEHLVLVLEPSNGSMVHAAAPALIAKVSQCGDRIGTIQSQKQGAGQFAVALIDGIKGHLPERIAKQLAFTEQIVRPPQADIIRLSATCLPTSTTPSKSAQDGVQFKATPGL
ncbi:MAG: hypothetical protein EKK49_11185 [Rhodocyclaceae bacterium]|nr:MAG: hypothetical protein EKK49_11185 [Rhodocyclaceae bacterium]